MNYSFEPTANHAISLALPRLDYHPDPPLQVSEITSPTTLDASPVDLCTLQLKAFLNAAEDIDIDTETLMELLQLLQGRLEEQDESSANAHVHDGHDLSTVDIDALYELDISALYSMDEGHQIWSQKERREFLVLLKERGMAAFVDRLVNTQCIHIPQLLLAFGIDLVPELKNVSQRALLYFLRVAMSRELRNRDKLPEYNTIKDAVNLIRNSKRILILTGAGISVSCGIPDFRSRNGLYASLGEYKLDDPQQMYVNMYTRNECLSTLMFYSQIYPANFVPSPCHRFIKLIEDKGKLLRNYTQNIDTLETKAGVQNVLQCHGSFATASCLQCRRKVPGTEIEAEIMKKKVPLCPVCNPSILSPKKKKKTSKKKSKGQWDSDVSDESDGPEYPPGIMKPDITFFGEKLSDQFDHAVEADRTQLDLLLVIGTSLKVSPVADLLSHIPHSVPQILINKTPIKHINPDIVLLGNADTIINHLCSELDWELPPPLATPRMLTPRNMKKRPSMGPPDIEEPERVSDSHVWLFEGAEGGKWLRDFELEIDHAEGRGVLEARNAKKMKV
ncbi:DHS-like NAD/FAD-binding domain-containing protein [Guyanagaster necrorhizus]|uniref:DHS-like NAD/FAD-binding domain-containing protein n=1 Tax=Guyanagaster necrorhizus TaxID=856835 RepID=A0A9P7VNH8_9AGAR|nr:DHS-like NAD/FAD-binding domain-containing protein [Guyanagaster necrorhizus MCA 3950]KAG7444451.1 DHS-like NAD/FAD-binding domain-containing protein [Guyanagaster necrorhizus MCA 3950]